MAQLTQDERFSIYVRYWTDFSRQIFTNFASLFIRRF